MLDIRRCEFITVLGGAAAWPLAARGQQGERIRRIGVLMAFAENDPDAQANITAFQHARSEDNPNVNAHQSSPAAALLAKSSASQQYTRNTST